MRFKDLRIAVVFLLLLGVAGGVSAQSQAKKPIPTVVLNPNSSIPNSLVIEILTLAAPEFNFTPTQFIHLYYTCNCIGIIQVNANTFRVMYGGIGIQIVIDATQLHPFRPRPLSLR
jgi:hypothetical protein